MNRVLIHGYSRGVESPFHQPDQNIAGFFAFADEVKLGQSRVFFWAKHQTLSLLTAYSPIHHLVLYFRERALVQSEQTLVELHNLLIATHPEQIVCHSLGCFLLTQYVLHYGSLPNCVQSVVFLQADCSEQELLKSGLLSDVLRFTNVYRRLDPALLFGSLMHRSWRIGLKPLPHLHVTNVYLPSFAHPNFHDAALSDPYIRDLQ